MRPTDVYLPSVIAPYGVHVSDDGAEGKGGRWGAFLREITSRPGWTIQRLADESTVNRSTIFRWMNGTIKNVELPSVRLIAKAAGVDLATALQAASDHMDHEQGIEELAGEVQHVIDDAGLPEEDRFVIAQMLLDEFDREEQERRRQRVERARTMVETWKRARSA